MAKAMQTFYRELFAHRQFGLAVDEMNRSLVAHEPTFGAFNAEALFRRIYRMFIAEKCSEQALFAREEAMVREFQGKFLQEHGRRLTQSELTFARTGMRKYIRDHQARFKEFRDRYFFVDLFPENAQRFEVSLEECQEGAPEE